MWHVSCVTCHVTPICGWTFSQNVNSLAFTVWEWRCSEDISTKDEWPNELLNHKGVLYNNQPKDLLGSVGDRWGPLGSVGLCWGLFGSVLGIQSLTRSLQSTPFQNPRERDTVAEEQKQQQQQQNTLLLSNIGRNSPLVARMTCLILIPVSLLMTINEDISFTARSAAAHKMSSSDIYYGRHCFPRGREGIIRSADFKSFVTNKNIS